MTFGLKRVKLFSLKNGLERPDSKYFVHDFQQDTNGMKADPQKNQKSSRPRQFLSESLDQAVQETKAKRNCKMGKVNATLQTGRRNRGIYEVSDDDNDYFKMIANVRLKPEK